MAASINAAHDATGRRRRILYAAGGAVLLALGVAGIGIAVVLELTSLFVFGVMLLATSVMQVLIALTAENWGGRLLHFAAAAAEAACGLLIMANPLESVGELTVLVVLLLAVGGLIRMARYPLTRSRARAWTVFTGFAALLLSISVWIGWPVTRLWLVGLCLAGDFVLHGISWFALAGADQASVAGPPARTGGQSVEETTPGLPNTVGPFERR